MVLSERRLSLFVPAAGAVGSLVDGAAAVSVVVGLGTEVGVPAAAGASVLLPLVEAGGGFFLRLKTAGVSGWW